MDNSFYVDVIARTKGFEEALSLAQQVQAAAEKSTSATGEMREDISGAATQLSSLMQDGRFGDIETLGKLPVQIQNAVGSIGNALASSLGSLKTLLTESGGQMSEAMIGGAKSSLAYVQQNISLISRFITTAREAVGSISQEMASGAMKSLESMAMRVPQIITSAAGQISESAMAKMLASNRRYASGSANVAQQIGVTPRNMALLDRAFASVLVPRTQNADFVEGLARSSHGAIKTNAAFNGPTSFMQRLPERYRNIPDLPSLVTGSKATAFRQSAENSRLLTSREYNAVKQLVENNQTFERALNMAGVQTRLNGRLGLPEQHLPAHVVKQALGHLYRDIVIPDIEGSPSNYRPIGSGSIEDAIKRSSHNGAIPSEAIKAFQTLAPFGLDPFFTAPRKKFTYSWNSNTPYVELAKHLRIRPDRYEIASLNLEDFIAGKLPAIGGEVQDDTRGNSAPVGRSINKMISRSLYTDLLGMTGHNTYGNGSRTNGAQRKMLQLDLSDRWFKTKPDGSLDYDDSDKPVFNQETQQLINKIFAPTRKLRYTDASGRAQEYMHPVYSFGSEAYVPTNIKNGLITFARLQEYQEMASRSLSKYGFNVFDAMEDMAAEYGSTNDVSKVLDVRNRHLTPSVPFSELGGRMPRRNELAVVDLKSITGFDGSSFFMPGYLPAGALTIRGVGIKGGAQTVDFQQMIRDLYGQDIEHFYAPKITASDDVKKVFREQGLDAVRGQFGQAVIEEQFADLLKAQGIFDSSVIKSGFYTKGRNGAQLSYDEVLGRLYGMMDMTGGLRGVLTSEDFATYQDELSAQMTSYLDMGDKLSHEQLMAWTKHIDSLRNNDEYAIKHLFGNETDPLSIAIRENPGLLHSNYQARTIRNNAVADAIAAMGVGKAFSPRDKRGATLAMAMALANPAEQLLKLGQLNDRKVTNEQLARVLSLTSAEGGLLPEEDQVAVMLASFAKASSIAGGRYPNNKAEQFPLYNSAAYRDYVKQYGMDEFGAYMNMRTIAKMGGGDFDGDTVQLIRGKLNEAVRKTFARDVKDLNLSWDEGGKRIGSGDEPSPAPHSGKISTGDIGDYLYRQAINAMMLGRVSKVSSNLTQVDWNNPDDVARFGAVALEAARAYEINTTGLKTNRYAEFSNEMKTAQYMGLPFQSVFNDMLSAQATKDPHKFGRFSLTNFANAFNPMTMSLLQALQQNPMSMNAMQQMISYQNALDKVDSLTSSESIAADQLKGQYLQLRNSVFAKQMTTGALVSNEHLDSMDALLAQWNQAELEYANEIDETGKKKHSNEELQKRKREFLHHQGLLKYAKMYGATERNRELNIGAFASDYFGGLHTTSEDDAFTRGFESDDALALKTAVTVGANEQTIGAIKERLARQEAERRSDEQKLIDTRRGDLGGKRSYNRDFSEGEPTGYSWSQLHLAETDPSEWYVRYVEGIKEGQGIEAAIGSAIHRTVEGWAKTQLGRTGDIKNETGLALDFTTPKGREAAFRAYLGAIVGKDAELRASYSDALSGKNGKTLDDSIASRISRVAKFARDIDETFKEYEVLGTEGIVHPDFGKKREAGHEGENVASIGFFDLLMRNKRTGQNVVLDLKPETARTQEKTQAEEDQAYTYTTELRKRAGFEDTTFGLIGYLDAVSSVKVGKYDKTRAARVQERLQAVTSAIQDFYELGAPKSTVEAALRGIQLVENPDPNTRALYPMVPRNQTAEYRRQMEQMPYGATAMRQQDMDTAQENYRHASDAYNERYKAEIDAKSARGMAKAVALENDFNSYMQELSKMQHELEREGRAPGEQMGRWQMRGLQLNEWYNKRVDELRSRGLNQEELAALTAQHLINKEVYEQGLRGASIYDPQAKAEEIGEMMLEGTVGKGGRSFQQRVKKLDDEVRRSEEASNLLSKQLRERYNINPEDEWNEETLNKIANIDDRATLAMSLAQVKYLNDMRNRLVGKWQAEAMLGDTREALTYQQSLMNLNERFGFGSENRDALRRAQTMADLEDAQLKILNNYGFSNRDEFNKATRKDRRHFRESLTPEEARTMALTDQDLIDFETFGTNLNEYKNESAQNRRNVQLLRNIRRNSPGQVRATGIVGRSYMQLYSMRQAYSDRYNDYLAEQKEAQGIINRYDSEKERRTLTQDEQKDYAYQQKRIGSLNDLMSAEKENIDAISDSSGTLIVGMNAIGDTFTRLTQMFGRRIFMKLANEVAQFVKQYDSAMTDIQMITLKTDEEMQAVSEDNISTAVRLQTDVTSVAGAKTALYRQGLTDAEVEERTEQVIKFAKVAGIKTETASKIITTALQNGLVDSAQDAIDVLAALGDSAATTADEIQKALQKTAATAANTGTSYQQLTALLTVAISKTQLSGNVVGTALSTIMTRMRRVNESGYVKASTGEKTTINEVDAALSRVGVNIRNENGKMRDTISILKDLAKVWGTIEDDVQKQNIVYSMAGRGSAATNTFYSIMEGLSEDGEFAEKLNVAIGSTGIVDKKYSQYIDTLNGKLAELKASFQGLIDTTVSSGIAGFFIDLGSGMMQALTATTGWGVALTSLGAIISSVIVKIKMLAAANAAKVAGEAVKSSALSLLATPAALGVGLGIAGIVALVGKTIKDNQEIKANDRAWKEYGEQYLLGQNIEQRNKEISSGESALDKIKQLMSKGYTNVSEELKNSSDFSTYESALSELGEAFSTTFASDVEEACTHIDGFIEALNMVQGKVHEIKTNASIENALDSAALNGVFDFSNGLTIQRPLLEGGNIELSYSQSIPSRFNNDILSNILGQFSGSSIRKDDILNANSLKFTFGGNDINILSKDMSATPEEILAYAANNDTELYNTYMRAYNAAVQSKYDQISKWAIDKNGNPLVNRDDIDKIARYVEFEDWVRNKLFASEFGTNIDELNGADKSIEDAIVAFLMNHSATQVVGSMIGHPENRTQAAIDKWVKSYLEGTNPSYESNDYWLYGINGKSLGVSVSAESTPEEQYQALYNYYDQQLNAIRSQTLWQSELQDLYDLYGVTDKELQNDMYLASIIENARDNIDIYKQVRSGSGKYVYSGSLMDLLSATDFYGADYGYTSAKSLLLNTAYNVSDINEFKAAITNEDLNAAINEYANKANATEKQQWNDALATNDIGTLRDFLLKTLIGTDYKTFNEYLNSISAQLKQYGTQEALLDLIEQGNYGETEVSDLGKLIGLSDLTLQDFETNAENYLAQGRYALGMQEGAVANQYADILNKIAIGNENFAKAMSYEDYLESSPMVDIERKIIESALQYGIGFELNNGRIIATNLEEEPYKYYTDFLRSSGTKPKSYMLDLARQMYGYLGTDAEKENVAQMFNGIDAATLKQYSSSWADLVTLYNMTEEERAGIEGQNLERKIKIRFITEGLDDLEEAGQLMDSFQKSLTVIIGADKVASNKELQSTLSGFADFANATIAYANGSVLGTMSQEQWNTLAKGFDIYDIAEYQNGNKSLSNLSGIQNARKKQLLLEAQYLYDNTTEKSEQRKLVEQSLNRAGFFRNENGEWDFDASKAAQSRTLRSYEDALQYSMEQRAVREAVFENADKYSMYSGFVDIAERALKAGGNYETFFNQLNNVQKQQLAQMIDKNELKAYELEGGAYDLEGIYGYLFNQKYGINVERYDRNNPTVAKYLNALLHPGEDAYDIMSMLANEVNKDQIMSALQTYAGEDYNEAYRQILTRGTVDADILYRMLRTNERQQLSARFNESNFAYADEALSIYDALYSEKAGASEQARRERQEEMLRAQRANYAIDQLGTNQEDIAAIASLTGVSEEFIRNMVSTKGETSTKEYLKRMISDSAQGVLESISALIAADLEGLGVSDISIGGSADEIRARLESLDVEISDELNSLLDEYFELISGFGLSVNTDKTFAEQYQEATKQSVQDRANLLAAYNAIYGIGDATIGDVISNTNNWSNFVNSNPALAWAMQQYAGNNTAGITSDMLKNWADLAMFGGSSSEMNEKMFESVLPGLTSGELSEDAMRELFINANTGDNAEWLNYLLSVYPELQAIMKSLGDDTIDTSEAIKSLHDRFRDDKFLKKYGDDAESVSQAYKNLSKNARTATKEYGRLTTVNNKLSYSYKMLDSAMGKAGKNLTADELSELSSVLEIPEELIKEMGPEELKTRMQQAMEGIDEQGMTEVIAPWWEKFQNAVENYSGENVAEVKAKIALASADGVVDTSELLSIVSMIDQNLAAELQSYIGTGTWIQAAVKTGKNAVGYVWELLSGGIGKSGKKTGGGGGGGGKSATAKLIEELKRELAEREHYIKMIKYQETKYEKEDELTNVNRMLELENEAQAAYIEDIIGAIERLKNQMKTLKIGSDDWYSARDAILSYEEAIEEASQAIRDNTKKMEENHQAILKTRTDLEDTTRSELENREKIRKEMLSGRVSMEDAILDAIRTRYQNEWDLIQKDIDTKRQALQEEEALIDERLQKRKEAEEEAQKYEQLAEYQRQLAMISMDPTRTKDAMELRKKISELQEDISWSIAEREAEAQKAMLEDQATALDEYSSIGDERLQAYLEDANNFAAEVNEIMRMSFEDMSEWLAANTESYKLALDAQQEQMVQGWKDTFDQMYHIVETYAELIKQLLIDKDTWMSFMFDSDEYKQATEEMQEQLAYQWAEQYDKYVSGRLDYAEYSHSDDFSNLGTASGSGSGGKTSGSGASTTTEAQQTTNVVWNAVTNAVSAVGSAIGSLIGGLFGGAKKNAEGGLVDYTGFTWVDGTLSRPESFLDADDTALLRNYLDEARYVGVRLPMFSPDGSMFSDTKNTIGNVEITINEATISSDEDIETLAHKIGESFTRELSVNGFNTASYAF